MLRWLLILVAVCFCVPVSGWGQEVVFNHYTVEDGLPSNTVYTVYRDSKGFIWVTTNRGVARYSGIRFEKFTTFNGLADNEVFACREDKEGRLWFVCSNGDLCYYKDDTFHNPRNTPFLEQGRKHPYGKFASVLKDGSIIFTFYNGSYLCYVEKNKVYPIEINHHDAENSTPFHTKKIGKGRFKLIRRHENYIVEVDDKGTRLVSAEKVDNDYSDKVGCQDQDFIAGPAGIYSVDEKMLYRFSDSFVERNFLHQVYRNDKYWFVTTNHGLFVDNCEDKRGMFNILENKDVSCVTQGTNGDYWVSTLNEGLYLLPQAFESTRVCAGGYSGSIRFSQEAGGQLFFSNVKNHVYRFEPDKNRGVALFTIPDVRDDFSSATYIDSNQSLHFFSPYLNVDADNLLTGINHVRKTRGKIFPCVFKKVIAAGEGIYYINAGTNVVLEKDEWRYGGPIKFRPMLSNFLQRVFSIAQSLNGDVWFTTIDKVYKVENEKGVEQRQFGGVTFKQFDFLGNYLVGYTQYNQLLICDRVTEKPKIDTILRDCVWENLYRVDSSHMLVTTNGLCYLISLNYGGATSPYSVTAIESRFVPLQAEEVCIGKDNCYFFKNGSIIKLSKAELLKRGVAPKVSFATLRTQKGSIRIDSVVELPYSLSGNISISFSTLSFDGKDLIYQYSISKDGHDKWINFKGDINLANQAFGSYTVKVRAKTLSSDWSDQNDPVAFTLVINRPFWAEWWFVGLAVCVTASLIYLVVKRRIQQTLKHREREHENKVKFIKSEYKAMNALMNPHFIFNTLNNVQSLVNNDDKLNAIEYLAIFADLVRQNMHNIANEIIPLQKELELVENYLLLEKLRFEDQLNYAVEVSDNVYAADIMVPPLLIQPLVENSIKHGILSLKSRGVKGAVRVVIYEKDDSLYIEVRDNGVGLAKARERKSLHKSFGLDNLKRRLEQLSIIQGKEITFDISEVVDENGVHWTVATIAMPIGEPVASL